MKIARQGVNTYKFTFDLSEPAVNYRKALKGVEIDIISDYEFDVHANPLQFPFILRKLREVAQSDEGLSKTEAAALVRGKLRSSVPSSPHTDITKYILYAQDAQELVAKVYSGGGSFVTASFTASVASGDFPLTVDFTDASTGKPTSWHWDFGDGSTSEEQNPSHTYADVGTYTVSLTAGNLGGYHTATVADFIDVTSPTPPVASFSGSPVTGDAPLSVQFTDQSTNSPTSWAWTFGDGGTSSAQNPSYTYQTTGTFNVSLTATNEDGTNTTTRLAYITVSDPGGLVIPKK